MDEQELEQQAALAGAEELDPNDLAGESVEDLLHLAEAYEAQDKLIESLTVLNRVLELEPDNREALEDRAWLQEQLGQPTDVRSDITHLLESHGDNPEAVLTAASLYVELEDLPAARFQVDRAVELAQGDFDTLFRAASIYGAANEPEAADALYEQLKAQKPGPVLLARARLKAVRQDFTGALADLNEALAAPSAATDESWTEQSRAPIYLARAEALVRLELVQEGLADLDTVIELAPPAQTLISALTLRGTLLSDQGQVERARADLNQALMIDPASLTARLELSSTYSRARDWETATEILDEAPEEIANDRMIMLTRALMHGEQGDLEAALDDWDKLVKDDPQNAMSYAMRGTFKVYLERFSDAESDFTRALQLNPTNSTAMQGRVSMAMRSGDLDSARIALDRALRQEPDNLEFLVVRGQILLQMEKYIEGVVDFNHVMQLDPGNPAALSGTGAARMALGQHESALRDFEQALVRDPGSPFGLYNLATAQSMLGRCPQAVASLQQAVRVEPELARQAETDRFFAGCATLKSFRDLVSGVRQPDVPTKAPRSANKSNRAPRGKRS